jgi:PAS domain S-box-containing protein
MRETRQTARNILILVNAVIASGAFILKIVDPIVVSYTEDIRKADLFNFLVFTPMIMIILSLLLHRTLQPIVRLSALGGTMDHEQAQELRTAAFNLPLKVLFLFNLVILSIVGFVALGFDAVFFPFYPFYKRVISMGLIWSYTVCSSLAVYVYVKRRMVPILRNTSGLAADKGRRTSIKTSMVATTITLSAMILLFLSVYGYSKTREALIRDDEETANALLYSVKQKAAAHNDLHSLTAFIASQSSGNKVYLVDALGATLAGSPRRPPESFAPQVLPDRNAVPRDSVEENGGMRIKRLPLDAPFNGLYLATAYRIDQKENAIMRNMTFLFLVIGVFFLFFAGIISYSVGGETSTALADIEKRMKRISEDKETLYEEFEVVSLDEVGDLTRAFNSLQRAIHRQSELIEELEEKKHHLEKGQLREAVQKATTSFLESELKFRTLAETTTAGIFIHRNGKLIYANPAGESLVCHTSAELFSLDFWQIFHPDDRDLVQEHGQVYPAGKKLPGKYEFRILTKQGEMRWVNIASGGIEYEGSPAVVATVFDITDRKQAEEEKIKLFEERIAEENRHIMEKEKILMDLHDGIGGITTNISILSELAQKETDVEGVKKTLVTISQLAREGISEIRGIMYSLDTKELNWRTMASELRIQGANLVEPHSISFTIETRVDDVQEQPSSLVWVNVFKIYKEALTNVIKHAHARSVAVMLKVTANVLFLTIQDDGTGRKSKSEGGRGLSNMWRRAEEIGGRLTLSSESGTRVSLEVPLPIKYPTALGQIA